MTDDTPDRREGRGRLSSIDLLPDEAEPDVIWALDQLRDRKMPQTAILIEFNARLADRGIAGISKSSWSRYAVRKAIQFRKLDEVRRLTADIVSNLGTDGPDQVTVAVAEMIKASAYELLEKGVNSKGLQEVSRAVQTAVNAQKASAEARRKLEDDVEQRLAKARAAIENVGKQKGVSAETLAEINRALGAA
ncbi:Protein of unknown function [Sphingobium faniae]|nr:Protein of unknown function [Sphingobium faniae]